MRLVKRPQAYHVARGQKKLVYTVLTVLLAYYAVFYVFPIAYALTGSFFNWNIAMGKFDFNGLANYRRVFAAPKFRASILNSVLFSLVTTGLRLGVGCLVAVLIFYVGRRAQTMYRMIYFLPMVLSMVAASYLWKWFFNTNNGFVNMLLGMLGVQGPNWLKSPDFAMTAVIVTTVWKDAGFAVIMYSSGLWQISPSVYEAAQIDGASRFHVFRSIMLPMLGAVTLFMLITSLNGYIQAFDQFFVLTSGGPGTSSYVMGLYLYEMAFKNYNFGQASAISFVMTAIIVALSVCNLKLTRFGREAVV